MSAAEVFEGGDNLYTTSSVRSYGAWLSVNRLDANDQRLVSNLGPHFMILQPRVPLVKDASFQAEGEGMLGSVEYLSGAWAGDGSERFHISRLSANYRHDDTGLRMEVSVQVGAFDAENLAIKPGVRPPPTYRLKVSIPFANYFEFWNVQDPKVQGWERDRINAALGAKAAEQIRVD